MIHSYAYISLLGGNAWFRTHQSAKTARVILPPSGLLTDKYHRAFWKSFFAVRLTINTSILWAKMFYLHSLLHLINAPCLICRTFCCVVSKSRWTQGQLFLKEQRLEPASKHDQSERREAFCFIFWKQLNAHTPSHRHKNQCHFLWVLQTAAAVQGKDADRPWNSLWGYEGKKAITLRIYCFCFLMHSRASSSRRKRP